MKYLDCTKHAHQNLPTTGTLSTRPEDTLDGTLLAAGHFDMEHVLGGGKKLETVKGETAITLVIKKHFIYGIHDMIYATAGG